MNITLNGNKVELVKDMTLIELLEQKGIEPERVIIEHNYNILVRDYWKTTKLKEDDNVEVLRFVGGG